MTRYLTPDDGKWSAHGTWVAEHCAEQPEEPEPLFTVNNEANAQTVVRIHNELIDENRRLWDTIQDVINALDNELARQGSTDIDAVRRPPLLRVQAALAARVAAAPTEARCCEWHNENCEPPGDLCCGDCTEYHHGLHGCGPHNVTMVSHHDGSACSWLAAAPKGHT